MTHPPHTPKPLDIAHRVLELNALRDKYLKTQEYETAAGVNDELRLAKNELDRIGSRTLVHNVRVAMDHPLLHALPIVKLLEPKDSTVDQTLLESLASAPLPVRWLVFGSDLGAVVVETLRKRLEVESLESAYYRTGLPLLCYATMNKATYIHEWIKGLARDTATSEARVIWICSDLDWLRNAGIWDSCLLRFQDLTTEFVICSPDRGALGRGVIDIPGIIEINP